RSIVLPVILCECGLIESLTLRRGLVRSVAVQGMDGLLITLFRRRLHRPRCFGTAAALLHPGRRACRCQGIVRGQLRNAYRLRRNDSWGGPWRNLNLGSGTACSGKWIVLADQASKLSQRIAFGPRRAARCHAPIQIIGHEVSILVTFSHRDDASPSG